MQSAKEVFNQYLQVCPNRLSSKESKERAFRFFIEAVGDLSLEEIRYQHAEDYRGFLNGRAAKTQNLYLTHIKTFLKWCVKRGYLTINPFADSANLPCEDKMTQPYEEPEVLRLFKVADLRWKCMILLAYVAGLRAAEALNLLKTDFLFNKQMLQIQPKKKGTGIWEWSIKNRLLAYCPLPGNVMIDGEKIEFHQLLQERFNRVWFPYPMQTESCYERAIKAKRQPPTKWIYAGNFDRQFKKLCQLALVRRGSYQCLRVTYGQRFIEANYKVKEVQSLLRHRSANTTLRYYNYVNEANLVRKASESFMVAKIM